MPKISPSADREVDAVDRDVVAVPLGELFDFEKSGHAANVRMPRRAGHRTTVQSSAWTGG